MIDINKHYIITVTPKDPNYYNPIHEAINGCEAVPLMLEVGDRGWISYKVKPEYYDGKEWHRLHISVIRNIEEDDNGISIETEFSWYRLEAENNG